MQLAHTADMQRIQSKLEAETERANKLSAANTALAGHANTKQKIRHLEKMKEEKLALRAETQQMKAELDRLRAENWTLKNSHPHAHHNHGENSLAARGILHPSVASTGSATAKGKMHKGPRAALVTKNAAPLGNATRPSVSRIR